MTSFPIKAKALDALFKLWGQTVTVQSQTQTVSSFGEVASTWTDRSSMSQVKARIAVATRVQMENAERSGYIVTHQVYLPRYFSAIQLSDRLVTTSVNYDVRQIQHDSAQLTTKLLVRRVESPST